MINKADEVFKIWKNEVVYKVKEYNPYKISEQLQQFANLFSLGPFYYYVLNFHDLSIDYAHETTEQLLGIPSQEFSMETLLARLPEEELVELQQKEALAVDFFNNIISRNEALDYKVVYFFKAYNKEGELRTFLHQATTIKQTDEGAIEHVLGVQMDVTDFKIIKNNRVSFIGLEGKPSYYNIDPTKIPYDYTSQQKIHSPLRELLSQREIEIIELLSQGYSSKQIAAQLFITTGTVSSHRKNIKEKTGVKSTAELISRCLVEGVI